MNPHAPTVATNVRRYTISGLSALRLSFMRMNAKRRFMLASMFVTKSRFVAMHNTARGLKLITSEPRMRPEIVSPVDRRFNRSV